MKAPVWLATPLLKCFRNNSFILMYHGVTGPEDEDSNLLGKHVPVALFAAQLAFLKRHFRILPLDDLMAAIAAGHYPRNSLAITFDDGYRNFYWHAFPVLKRLGLTATVFLATGFIDAQRWARMDGLEYAIIHSARSKIEVPGLEEALAIQTHEEKIAAIRLVKNVVKGSDIERAEVLSGQIRESCGVTLPEPFGNYQFLTWAEVRKMAGQGISFGPHTVNHAILSRCATETAEWEIVESKREVERQTGQSSLCFCYPNGMPADYNQAVKDICARHFSCALAARFGILQASGADLYETRRIGLTRETTVASLSQTLLRQMIKNCSLLR